jgi:hypothetical protein
MKLKKYLEEGIIAAPKKSVDYIVFKLDTAIKSLRKQIQAPRMLKNGELKLSYANDIIDALNDALHSENITFHISFVKASNPYSLDICNAQAGFYEDTPTKLDMREYGIEVILHENFFINTLPNLMKGDTSSYQQFLKDFRRAIEHEMIHREQASRLASNSNMTYDEYINKSERLKKKYDKDAYFLERDEIMAHARDVVLEIRSSFPDMTKENIMKLIDNNDTNIMFNSKSYKMFYTKLHDNHPKEWKKFVKYIKDYLRTS